MNRLEALVDMVKSNELKVNELLRRKDKEEEKKKCHTVLWVLAIIGCSSCICGIPLYETGLFRGF